MLACAALAHAGCGRRLIGKISPPDGAGGTTMVDAGPPDGSSAADAAAGSGGHGGAGAVDGGSAGAGGGTAGGSGGGAAGGGAAGTGGGGAAGRGGGAAGGGGVGGGAAGAGRGGGGAAGAGAGGGRGGTADGGADAADGGIDAADAGVDASNGVVDGGADTPPVVPGVVAWKAEGWAAINAAGDFYTTAIHGDNVDVALVGRASGGRRWQRPGWFLCASGDTVVMRDNKSWGSTVAGVAALDGAPRWQLGRMFMGFCFPALDRFVAIETPDESLPTATLAVYRASDGRPVWSVGTGGVMASYPMVEGADASAVYFSWRENGKVMLRALRASDAHAQWTLPLVAADGLHFQFDAAGALFALDSSSQSPSVRRIDLARGSVAWPYPLTAGGGELITEGSAGFVVVRDGPNLLAIDKATGTRLWTYAALNDPSWQSWDVRFLRSGELVVSQRSANEIPYSGTIAHSTLHTVVSAAGVPRWSVGPHTAVLPVTSGPRTFFWETPAGELYDTTYGVLARLDPATGNRLWTSTDVTSVDRVIGSDGDLVLVTGPAQSCCFQPEWVRAASKTNGESRWLMSEQFPMGISLLTSDRDHIFLAAPPDGRYTPSTTVAIWK